MDPGRAKKGMYDNFYLIGLMELEMIGENFRSLLNAVTMHKCIQAK